MAEREKDGVTNRPDQGVEDRQETTQVTEVISSLP
jgi:hypothetical protein